MREAATFSEASPARRVSDYLLTQGIDTHVTEEGDHWTLWVLNEDHLAKVRAEVAQFRAETEHPRYRGVSGTAGAIRRREARAQAKARKNYVDVRTQWGNGANHVRPLTKGLIGLCLVVFAGQKFGGAEALADVLFIASPRAYYYGLGLAEVRAGQVWRLITPIFMHGDFLHIIFNLYWLYFLGSALESRKGSAWSAFLVVATAVGSNLLQYWWGGPHFLGMSGVVYGLLGYLWMRGRYAPQEGLGIDSRTWMIMMIWLVVCMLGIVGPVANAAHVGGLGMGMILASRPLIERQWRRLRRRQW